MEIYDEVLGKKEKVHQEVTPEVGIYIELEEPEEFAEIFKDGGEE